MRRKLVRDLDRRHEAARDVLRCYNGLTLREQSAPEETMRQVPIQTPAEIGQ